MERCFSYINPSSGTGCFPIGKAPRDAARLVQLSPQGKPKEECSKQWVVEGADPYWVCARFGFLYTGILYRLTKAFMRGGSLSPRRPYNKEKPEHSSRLFFNKIK